jgi:hypothetical protein
MTNSKGTVILGLHTHGDPELFSRPIARAGYTPVACFSVDGILSEASKGFYALIMDLNFKHPNQVYLDPSIRVVDFLKSRNEKIHSVFMGLSGNEKVIEAAHALDIPGYKHRVEYADLCKFVTFFIKREEQFSPTKFPEDPASLRQYLREISGLPKNL